MSRPADSLGDARPASPPGRPPTIAVQAPPGYEAERRYILETVLGEWLGLGWELRTEDRTDVRLTLGGDSAGAHVSLPDALFATGSSDWLTVRSLPRSPVPWRPVRVGPTSVANGRLPLLYGVEPAPAALLTTDGSAVHLAVDVFGGAFFMLSRYEELVVTERDEYGRLPVSCSVAQREGFLGLPVVDAYVELLWVALTRAWPRLRRRAREFRIAVTHDVDHPLAFLGRTARERVRQLAGDAIVRRDPRLAVRRVRSWTAIPRGDYGGDPYNTFDFLMDVSERHGLAGAFYFLATEERSDRNGFYTVEDPWIQGLMRTIAQRGHEIGFHAGFDTFQDPRRTKEEFDRLRRVADTLGVSPAEWGGRQHYLRWENPTTWSNWERAGLAYDSTVGYADEIGFRAGTCHEFRAFDLVARQPMTIRERPLHVMDRTLFEYMNLAPDVAAQAALEIARECRRVDGTFTLLWHNSVLQTAAERRWYEELVDALAGLP